MTHSVSATAPSGTLRASPHGTSDCGARSTHSSSTGVPIQSTKKGHRRPTTISLTVGKRIISGDSLASSAGAAARSAAMRFV